VDLSGLVVISKRVWPRHFRCIAKRAPQGYPPAQQRAFLELANMKRRTWRSISCSVPAAILFLSVPCAAQQPVKKRPDERSQIESVLQTQQEAWNHGDIDAFLQGYWHSPQLTFSGSSGTSRGWEGVLQRYR
jgi:hypothetical protein